MSIQTEIDRIKGNIASAYTAAGAKGATIPDVQNSANLAGCIDTITVGASEEWQPNPNWWDIRKILDEDTRDYKGKVGVILYNFNDVSDFRLNSSGMTAVATSDGAFYTYADNGINISHNWDTSKDKDDGRGLKTRWVIYYYTTDTTNDTFSTTAIPSWGWQYNCVAYIVLRINCTNAQSFCSSNPMLEGIDNVGYVVKGTSFRFFCQNNFSLQKTPDNLDTSNGTDFSYFCSTCYPLQKTPDNLDTSNGTNFSYFFYNCNSLQKVPDNLDTSNGTNFNYFFSNCRCLSYMQDSLDTSKGTNFSNCFSSCDSLQKAPTFTMAANTTNISSQYSGAVFTSCSWLKEVRLTLPSNTNFWLSASTRISIESFRYIADHAPNVTATPRTLTVGSTNITRINEADPTIITDLNAKGWTVA